MYKKTKLKLKKLKKRSHFEVRGTESGNREKTYCRQGKHSILLTIFCSLNFFLSVMFVVFVLGRIKKRRKKQRKGVIGNNTIFLSDQSLLLLSCFI